MYPALGKYLINGSIVVLISFKVWPPIGAVLHKAFKTSKVRLLSNDLAGLTSSTISLVSDVGTAQYFLTQSTLIESVFGSRPCQ